MLHLTNDNFKSETASGKVVVDFWAEWCGPCKMLGPVFESLSQEMRGIKFAKVNVDENQEISSEFNIRSIPTVMLFKDGQKVGQMLGFMPKESIRKKIEGIFG